MKNYTELKEKYLEEFRKLRKNYNIISFLRLIVVIAFLFSLYYYIKNNNSILILCLLLELITFIFLMRIHERISWRLKIRKTLMRINEDELNYLKRKNIPFEDGTEYNDHSHYYSYDLDIFGKNSLYQNLNRTATYIGKTKLAGSLLTLLPYEEIKQNQEAVKELSKKLNWRQGLLALAKLTNDSNDSYNKIIYWSKIDTGKQTRLLVFVSYALPILLWSSSIAYFFTKHSAFTNFAFILFLSNLLILILQFKKLKKEIINSDKIHEIIKRYSMIIEKIEKESFESTKLNALKKQLNYRNGGVSLQIRKLSALFANMNSIQNAIGAIIFNGFFLYHIHTLKALLNWKREYSSHISTWLDVIGEFEMLNSLANFSFNNPTFIFPILNSSYKIILNDLGHPLINEKKRICNTIRFDKHRFVILTGSNMSGKSTFLRTLGINMVLAGIGSPICSSYANIHPMNVLVSMQLTDSLNDGESYFFAEVKRLKKIMNILETKVCFVLLDEILRGTNSDDKRTGTNEVIKNIISKKAIGAIATHDLEVCLTTETLPNILVNKYFEVDIINNDLSFDYKLRDGVCKNKNATFLMKKIEII